LRLKTIEQELSLRELYNFIQELLQNAKYKLHNCSSISNSNFLIISKNEKNIILIIRVSLDHNFHRTYISVLSYNTKLLLKFFRNVQSEKDDFNSIGKNIYQLLKRNNEKGFKYPFLGFSKLNLTNTSIKIRLSKIETTILNKISRYIIKNFNYSDDLMKFPFSITQSDGSWELWKQSYSSYVNLIEKKIKENQEEDIKVYRNFDFALTRDIFQRIFDLVIIKTEEIKSNEYKEGKRSGKKLELKKMYNYIITFIYCNKTIQPFSLMRMLKIMNEIKTYSKQYMQKFKQTLKSAKVQLVLISVSGYEEKIKNYLREHIYRDTEYVIPILIIPPINNEIWHNLKYGRELSDFKQEKKEELKKIIRISKIDNISPSFKSTRAKKAKDQYKELVKNEKSAKKDTEFLKKWFLILNVDKSNQEIKAYNGDNQIPNNLDILKDNVKLI
jgi:hypothetical protein